MYFWRRGEVGGRCKREWRNEIFFLNGSDKEWRTYTFGYGYG